MDGKESDSSTLDGSGTQASPAVSGLPESSKLASATDDSGYHTPYDNDRRIVASPSSPFDEGYNEDLILSDEELVDYMEDDDEDGEEDGFRSGLGPLGQPKQLGMTMSGDGEEAEENDADDESEVDKNESTHRSSANRDSLVVPPTLDPTSPRTRRNRRALAVRRSTGRDPASSRSHLIRYIRSKVGSSRTSSEVGTGALEGNVSPDQIEAEDSSTSEDSYDDDSSDSSQDMCGIRRVVVVGVFRCGRVLRRRLF